MPQHSIREISRLEDEMRVVMQEALAIIEEAGMSSFSPSLPAYLSNNTCIYPISVVELNSVEPFVRAPGVPRLVKERAIRILEHMRQNKALNPIIVDCALVSGSPYSYRLCDGFHRFHLSLALGYSHIYVGINPFSER